MLREEKSIIVMDDVKWPTSSVAKSPTFGLRTTHASRIRGTKRKKQIRWVRAAIVELMKVREKSCSVAPCVMKSL